MQLQLPWFKPAAWGVVVGAVATMIIGFSWLGWTLGSRNMRAAPPTGLVAIPVQGLALPSGVRVLWRRDERDAHVVAIVEVDFSEGKLAEFTHGVRFSACHHEIFWRVLLKHKPHRSDVIFGVSPVTSSIEVSESEFACLPLLDTSHRR